MAARRVVVGIDLAGSPARNTGIAVLAGKKFLHVAIAHADSEIISTVKKYRPAMVAIDAPLTLPHGRTSIKQNNGIHFIVIQKSFAKLFRLTISKPPEKA